MALWLLLVTVALVCTDDSLSTSEVTSGKPHITKCRSPEQETFKCYWTYGDYHNLSAPGQLKLQYKNKDLNWTDCPEPVSAGEYSCYFNETYTFVWITYCVQLVHEDEVFKGPCFSIDDIVEPDPPVALNYTLLNISMTKIHMDIQLTWEPPPSADVKRGWISLEYEVQIKEVIATQWRIVNQVYTTYLPLYALKVDKEYLVRVRCKQRSSKLFGEFSEILTIPLLTLPEDEPEEFPWLLFMISGIFGILVVTIIILFFKKKRLKILIFPPVPVPKIKGIDPDLLQKGKLDEVSSILACHDSYKPELYNDDPWVEFIELDLDDPDEKNDGSDTDRLLGEEHRQPQNIKENEADLLCLDEKANGESPTSVNEDTKEDLNMKPEDGKKWPLLINENGATNLPVSTQLSNLKPSMDFYALVSDITPAGRVLLFPGQRMKTENEDCCEPANEHPPNPNVDSPYICESAVAFCAISLPKEGEPNVKQSCNDNSYFTTESLTTAVMNSCSAEKAPSYEMPVSDYTSVHIINSPQNLVLNTTVLPDKEFLAPCGYMTPDQVNKSMP
ncbi:growth hormone receptor isoform 2-T5 [Discoglossus pictus]